MFRFAEIPGLARFALGLRGFLRDRLSFEAAERQVRDGVARRDERFLAKLRQAVFGNRRSPYLALCRWAGCEFGDLERLVASDGVERALEELRRAGVFVSWEELKGRQPVRRGSQVFEFRWEDFTNPIARLHYQSSSGGSSGPALRVGLDLEHAVQAAPDWAVMLRAHGLEKAPLIFWTPTHAGIASRYLKCAKFGMPLEKWFANARVRSFEDRLRSRVVHGIARLHGGCPKIEDAPLDRPEPVLSYILQRLADGARPAVNTSPSAAALLSRAALERGASLEGVHFLLGAEPVTPARCRTIEASGAKAIATYGTSEAGWIGGQFPGRTEPDEVHVFREAFAVIANQDREMPGVTGHPVLFTALRPAAPKVLLNAELGDAAVIETGCGGPPAERYGYDVRMHTIRSFRKITVWGATFAVADLDSIIEDYLPARFGGALNHYQLIEQQDERGTPGLRLLVSPALGAIDEPAIAGAFLDELARRQGGYRFMVEEVRVAQTLRIERSEPVATARGKVLAVIPERAR